MDTDPALLDEFCEKADFVFLTLPVNRAKENSEFMAGNFGFASLLLDALKKHHNCCPVMLASSIQATLFGRRMSVREVKLQGRICFLNTAWKPGPIF